MQHCFLHTQLMRYSTSTGLVSGLVLVLSRCQYWGWEGILIKSLFTTAPQVGSYLSNDSFSLHLRFSVYHVRILSLSKRRWSWSIWTQTIRDNFSEGYFKEQDHNVLYVKATQRAAEGDLALIEYRSNQINFVFLWWLWITMRKHASALSAKQEVLLPEAPPALHRNPCDKSQQGLWSWGTSTVKMLNGLQTADKYEPCKTCRC